jgi:hypothetical protein
MLDLAADDDVLAAQCAALMDALATAPAPLPTK